MMDIGFDGVDEKFLRRERAKARDLRKSRWWKQKIAQETCYYCQQKVERTELTMDHIVPLVRGGRSTKDNLVTACKSCNTKKRTMLPMEWEEYMDSIKTKNFTGQ
jgi:5-methylcytosine-specific restriction endonuclease McrA